jgi:transposase InsO family protein
MGFEEVSKLQQRQEMIETVMQKRMTVSEACKFWGVSRDTFYVWLRRFNELGSDGLIERSSRPRTSPNKMDWRIESEIVALRKKHKRWGARRIRAELKRAGWQGVPAVSSIHIALIRNGVIATESKASPATKRFEREQPGELLQIDGKEVVLTTGQIVHVVSTLDDHSRYCSSAIVAESLDCESAIEAFEQAVIECGFPFSVLADRGSCFTGKTKKTVNAFERHLWGYGVITLNGRPYHPQTQGKIERYHRTLGEWLEDFGPFRTTDELQRTVDEFRHDYNHLRPNQALNDDTPAERLAMKPWKPADSSANSNLRQRSSIRISQADGRLVYGDWKFGFGKTWAKHPFEVIDFGHIIEIKDGNGDLVTKFDPRTEPGHIRFDTAPSPRPRHP